MKKIIVIFLILVSNWSLAFSQDTLSMLSAEDLVNIIKLYHPTVKQASIGVQKSNADLLIARGAFDPIFRNNTTRKKFGGEDYYQYSNTELKIPTWYGIEVVGGTESLLGDRFDPSETSGKTSYYGINFSLVKNLVIDKRRAYLQQAKIYQTLAEEDRRNIINDILMQAMEDYWNWVKAYQTYIVVSNIVEINNTRLDFVRKSFNNGERAAIDTTEAFSQLQSFQILKNEKWLDFLNAGLELSIYLWTNKNQSYLLPQNIIPQTNWQTELKEDKYNLILADLLENASSNHPQLNMYRAKLNGLEIDRKLKMQELLPTLDVKYNQLSKTYNPFYNGNVSPLLENNFQYGLKIEMPLRISAGSGEYRKSLLKLEETKLAFAQKDVALEIKISKYFNQYLNLKNQIDLQKNNLLNYKQLVKAEETRLINGESNLFLINTRENKMLEAQEKLIELQTKYFKSIYALQWSAGLLQ